MRSYRALLFALLLLCPLFAGCGAAGRTSGARDVPTKIVRGHGLKIELPLGWHGEVLRPELPGALTLRAANFPLPPATDVGRQAQSTMTDRDVLITLSHYGWAKASSRVEQATLPLSIDRADFVSPTSPFRTTKGSSRHVSSHPARRIRSKRWTTATSW